MIRGRSEVNRKVVKLPSVFHFAQRLAFKYGDGWDFLGFVHLGQALKAADLFTMS